MFGKLCDLRWVILVYAFESMEIFDAHHGRDFFELALFCQLIRVFPVLFVFVGHSFGIVDWAVSVLVVVAVFGAEHLGWYMKRWADLYSFPAENKGGGFTIRPAKCLVTSQYHIYECFEDIRVVDAIQRRFTTIELTPWEQREAAKAQAEAIQARADIILEEYNNSKSIDTATTEEIPYEFVEPFEENNNRDDEEISFNEIPQHPDIWASILPRSDRISNTLHNYIKDIHPTNKHCNSQ